MRGPLKSLLKEIGIPIADINMELSTLTPNKHDVLEAGIQLGYLSKDDVLYICKTTTTDDDATRRLTNKRRTFV